MFVSTPEANMSKFLQRRLLSAFALVCVAVGLSGCLMIIPVCEKTGEIETNHAYRFNENTQDYDQPANTWIDNPTMASFLRRLVEKDGRQALVSQRGFECSAQPGADCPDCLVCRLTVRHVRNNNCEREGDMFIEAYVGPGTNVRAMTYWRRPLRKG